jgi:hypothetical protein
MAESILCLLDIDTEDPLWSEYLALFLELKTWSELEPVFAPYGEEEQLKVQIVIYIYIYIYI